MYFLYVTNHFTFGLGMFKLGPLFAMLTASDCPLTLLGDLAPFTLLFPLGVGSAALFLVKMLANLYLTLGLSSFGAGTALGLTCLGSFLTL